MKRFLITLTAILGLTSTACVMTSCGDDEPDAPVITNGITVDITALYKEFRITGNITTGLKQGAVTIIDSVLVYDQAGNLVTEYGSELNTLQPVTYDTKDLEDGTYKIIVWQTGKRDSTCWSIYDKEQLRTVKITTKYGNKGYPYVLGYAYATATVTDGKLNITLVPKAVCSLISLKIDNFTEAFAEEKGYDQVRLYGREGKFCNGLYLDPTRSDRWINKGINSIECIGTISAGKNSNGFLTLTQGNDLTLDLYTYNSSTKTKGTVLATCENVRIATGEITVFYFDLSRIGSQPPFYGTLEDFDNWKAEHP